MDEKFLRILAKVATYTSLLGSFTCRKFTTWDRRLYFPYEGRRAEDFFARKIRRLRPGFNPRTRVPKASTLTSRPPKQLPINYRGNLLSKVQDELLRCTPKKINQSHYRPGQALKDPGGYVSQISRQSTHEGGNVVNPTHRPPLPPRNIPGTYFC